MRTLAVAVVFLFALAGCFGGSEPEPEPEPEPDPEPTPTPPPPPPPEVSKTQFVVIGDQGTGNEDQAAVAAAVKLVCEVLGCDFVVALGDNIYEHGVSGTDDPQFQTKFEEPYADINLTFHMVLGNHDNGNDPVLTAAPSELTEQVHEIGLGHWWESGNTEVAYSEQSEKWSMPARYYSFNTSEVTFVALDTNLLMYQGYGITTEIENMPMPGEMEAWVDAELGAASTPWKLSLGHHPYVSNGAHGNAGNYEANNPSLPAGYEDIAPGAIPHPAAGVEVKAFYENHICDQVDIIFSGHDHNLQWLEPTADCDTEFIVTGAAGKLSEAGNTERNPVRFQQYNTLGFTWVQATEDTLTSALFDSNATALYVQSLTK